MKRFGLLLFSIFLFISCGTTKYIPTETKEKIVYRDSIVYRTDTVQIPIEREVLREVLPMVDTSYLETDLASSEAFLDTLNKTIHHTLTQKDTVIEEKIVYKDKIKIVEKEVLKEIPVEVEVIKKVVPKWCWYLLGANILVLVLFILKRKFLPIG